VYFECVVEVEEIFVLVVRNAAIDDSFLGGVDNDEGQLYGGVLGRRAVLLLNSTIPFDQVFEGDLLKNKLLQLQCFLLYARLTSHLFVL